MEENQTLRRIDFFSILAVIGVALMLMVEGFFVFELYESRWLSSAATTRAPMADVASDTSVLGAPSGVGPETAPQPSSQTNEPMFNRSAGDEEAIPVG